ncbi:HAD-IB family phosphatase [Desulfovibrio sp. OttesenSCG-928-A18]|nr:HAD-IB family phosphatase [Desulfovibrio sp. OttesenSCG-928-A18]
MSMAHKILVSDFDGTMTAEDFYLLAVERLLQPEDLRFWQEYRMGRITHFTALQSIFRRIRAPEDTVLELIRDMHPDPALADSVAALHGAGWRVIVASAGCAWYIDRILKPLGLSLEVYANPGTYHEGGPLEMEEPAATPFYSPETGVDKAGIVRFHLERGALTAYAGDGHTDLEAALLVEPGLRFARAALAGALAERGVEYRPFERWSDVARQLLAMEAGS